MCTHDAEKLVISVLEIYEDGYHQECLRSDEILCSNLWLRDSCSYEPQRAPRAFKSATTCFCHRAAEWALEIEGIEKEMMSHELGK
jgi:hypothetical protein